ncbi:leucine--tRNA ligase [uncultured Pseudokineococcus sp.]|uniref:leucine--tRNA ligase n=1 Tax=uncultured Pseudokineococcus sp. TaxID=1642928 RepID=UPI00261603AF|nr:class I tRNA ligase family protein [uncultured Pseudokineococcus sp.]
MAPENTDPAETPSPAPGAPAARYDAGLAAQVEARWQQRWLDDDVYAARTPREGGSTAFVMDMFPYPSGAGLHVGHPLGYIATDVYSRYLRMSGREVLHTLGYDAFGLPAEQYAVQTGTHPRTSTLANIATMREQLRRLGLGHDPHRSISTIDPAYYRWTQWIFLQVFGSWYDAEQQRARPITELVAAFEDGSRPTPDGRPWAELTAVERDDVLSRHRLAYADEAPVNWCPGLGTVLANEEVTAEGRSERGNFPVFTASLRQWKMRITAYADRLVDDLEPLDWPEAIKVQQRHWIGRSHGAHVRFAVEGGEGAGDGVVEVFTTRPDTLFGATYLVLAPEHPLVDTVLPASWPDATPAGDPLPQSWTGGAATPREAVHAYARRAAARTDAERQAEGAAGAKTGVFTGATATHPATGEQVPVFVADYVLMGYGTGAIMAVPAHDQRDFDFARALDLPLRCVVTPADDRGLDASTWDDAWTAKDGAVTGSDARGRLGDDGVVLDGLPVTEAVQRMSAWLDERGLGRATTSYRLRDWLFSRQRYWGEPFPVVYDEDGVAHAVPEDQLPVELPEVDDYSPRTFDPDDADTSPETPLSRREDWVHVELDLGDGPRPYRRETNTMPNWAGSCWYELRYLDPDNTERLVDPALEAAWMGPREGKPLGGVDLYVGGAEHAVLHLLYARFWHKVLHDLGHVSSSEPFHRLFNQGMIQAYVFRDARGIAVPAAEVEEAEGPAGTAYTWQGQPVTRELGKMGKSLKNAVAPDEIAAEYGADTLRLYEMGMGPLDAARPWETRAVVGSFRFLQRLWRNVVDETTGELRVTDEAVDDATARVLARTVDGVRRDYEGLRFNTALAKVIELNNHLVKRGSTPRAVAEQLVLLVAPLAPHVAEELWERLGRSTSLVREPFPEAEEALLVEDEVTAVVQVRGKVRARLQVPADITEDDLRERALAEGAVQRAVGDAVVRKVVVRPPSLVNVVV